MNKNQSQKIRLGIFIVSSIAILLFILLVVGGSKLLTKRKEYFIAYHNTSISGLEIGASVKYLGVRIGRVEDVSIDPKSVSRIIIKISVKDKVPIKTDVRALISFVGITGLKQVELTGGSDSAIELKSGEFIPTGKSLTDNISGKAEVITAKIESLLNNLLDITGGKNKENLKQLVLQTTLLLKNFNRIIAVNSKHIDKIIKNLGSFSKESVQLSQKANKSMTDLQAILGNLAKITDTKNTKNLNNTLGQFNGLLKDTQKMIMHLDLTILKSRGDYIRSMQLLRESLQNIREVSRMMTEDPSVLIRGVKEKRN